MNTFATRAASPVIKDFSDPDRAPGAMQREGDARYRIEMLSQAAKPLWDALAKKLKATNLVNTKTSDRFNPTWIISFNFPGGRVDMFRSEVHLTFKDQAFDGVDMVAFQDIWKLLGLKLYGMDFMTRGESLGSGMWNAINIGYYSSIADPKKGKKLLKAILAAVKLANKGGS